MPKPIEIDRKKLLLKCSTMNVDFNGSRKPAYEGIKQWYPCKSCYFTIVGQSFMKTVADRHGNTAYHNEH